MNIKKVIVIGSGTMGSGIAAQLCNANIPVTLLDLKTEISAKAKKRIFESRPPLLIDKSKIDNIKVGNIDENFDTVTEADWIVEAVVERIDIKHNLYKKILKKRKKESIISSNTSTIPLKVLSAKMSNEDKKDFCITHFFNPVRYMGLLEIVSDKTNDTKKINFLKNFCEDSLGKGVIICKDTPGFLGNRVGVYAMQVAMTEAINMKLNIEEADAVFGRPMGIPKTGVFGLYDLIGIDLMADVLKSFLKELPESDVFHLVAQEIPLVKNLIETGYTGRKGKGGFYRINKKDGKKILEAINLSSRDYSPSKKVDLNIDEKVNLKELVSRNDKYGEYAWSVISKIILYASSLVPSVTEDYNNIDEAMRLGFNWAKGPFEMLEELGVKFFVEKDDQLKINEFIKNLYNKKSETFYGKRQVYTNLETFGKVKQLAKTNKDNKSAFTYEHKNYKIVEFKTKANTLDYDSMDALNKASDKNMIIINEGMQFSAGVNLNYVMDFAKEKNWKAIEKFIHYFQMTCKQLKYSNNLVVSAPSGLALGGGFEVLVQSDYVVSHTNIVTGLVETLVGLIPAGGGTTNMLWRWMLDQESKRDPDFAPQKVFDIIGYGKTASSPIEAMPFKFLLEKDKSIMNRNKLLSFSQDLINEKKNGYKPPKKPTFKLSGSQVRDKMFQTLEKLFKENKILEHGLEVGKKLAFVLSGGNTTIDKELSEDDMYALELEAFIQLIQMEKTQARIKHTLSTGKPLVN
ncbi:MAG: 3-hydroxyacyl-CoA dehydrogenase/enoyl-CoA hydratase family protein [Candidatus Pelagibacterales bacterium]|nr:MAG: 3-hydroxyacyl-CoA dehydrogenase/enoyl-CoA hydratase family protein [Pelagibacterales bacterium]